MLVGVIFLVFSVILEILLSSLTGVFFCLSYNLICRNITEGFGKSPFPEWNPQRGLCPLEENREFQGVSADGTHLFILLSEQVEILIST